MNWDKPLLMLTMPNSGSTWFAQILADKLPGARYYREFFNPVCNMKYEAVLRRNFGSELVSCYENIVSEGDSRIDQDIRDTWGAENFNFTKECQSAFKLRAYLRCGFRAFVFLRPTEQSFPPGRARVWSFYEHAWYSLCAHGYLDPKDRSIMSTEARAISAHRIIFAHLEADAARRQVPVIYYDDLFAAPDVLQAKLAAAVGYDGERLVDSIVAGRRRADR